MNLNEEEVSLLGGQELRIDIGFDETLEILLEQGRGEVFGGELPPGTIRKFHGPDNFSVFTWHGCKLRLGGSCANMYTSNTEYQMVECLRAHGQVNYMRYKSCLDRTIGPKILVAGGSCCGKSAMCKLLLNYGSKCGWRPFFVELDVTNNSMYAPGCISAASYTQNSWDPILSYYYGHPTINNQQTELYKTVCTELAAQLHERFRKELEYSQTYCEESYDPRNNAYASGCIINFPPFLDMNLSEDILNFIIDAFKVDLVIIIDQERLFSSIRKRGIDPISLSKFGSIVPIQAEFKTRMQTHELNIYFSQFQIHQITLNFDEIKIYKVIVSSKSESTFTYGEEFKGERLILTQLAPSQEDLLNAIMGVLTDSSAVLKSSIYGLVHVTEVDESHRFIKILSPGVLPSKHFVLGTLKKLKK